MSYDILVLLAVLFLLKFSAGLFPVQLHAAELNIATWNGNTPDWDERLGVTMIRQACSHPPDVCLKNLAAGSATRAIPQWIIAIKGNLADYGDAARKYGQLSVDERRLVEIGIDDFASTMKSWVASTKTKAGPMLQEMISNAKLENPALRFGITLYEDDLTDPILTSIQSDIRAGVDKVVLYLHFRSSAINYAQYVADVRSLFPNASIWAGSYAYDRIDYLQCSISSDRSCSVDEELALYADSLTIQLDLMRNGSVAGIEFYPGFFGKEELWNGWRNPRICRPDRIQGCVETTLSLRSIAETALQDSR